MTKKRLKIAVLSTVAALAAQVLFEGLFGHENMMIGLMMMMAAYNLLNRDFTVRIVNNFIQLLILNCILVFASYLTSINTEIALIVNITIIFTVNYIYMNEFESPISFIFLMNYIIMWAAPVTLNSLSKRFLTIILGVFIIILGQIVFNKKTFTTKTRELLKEIISDHINQTDNIVNSIYNEDRNRILNKKIMNLLHLINSNNYKRFYYTKEAKILLNISTLLEKMNVLIATANKKKIDKNYLENSKYSLMLIYKYFNNEVDINVLDNEFHTFMNKYKENNDTYIYELTEILYLLKHNIITLNTKSVKELKRIDKSDKITREFTLIGKTKRNLSFDSLILKFSIKLAIVISIGMYIVDKSKLPYGKWIIITMYVIMQPYMEDTISKSKKRIKGTIIGVLVFLIVFYTLSISNQQLSNQIMLTLGIFLYSYFVTYDKQVIAITIICLSSVIKNGEVQRLSFNRVLYILAGIIIVMIINKYLFPYNINDSVKDLKKKYNNILKLILLEIKALMGGKKNQDKIIRLILLCTEIDKKLYSNNQRLNSIELNKFLNKRYFIMSDIRYLILQIYYIDKNYFQKKEINKKLFISLYTNLQYEILN